MSHAVSTGIVFVGRPPLAAQARLAITTAADLHSSTFHGLDTWQTSLTELHLHWTGLNSLLARRAGRIARSRRRSKPA